MKTKISKRELCHIYILDDPNGIEIEISDIDYQIYSMAQAVFTMHQRELMDILHGINKSYGNVLTKPNNV